MGNGWACWMCTGQRVLMPLAHTGSWGVRAGDRDGMAVQLEFFIGFLLNEPSGFSPCAPQRVWPPPASLTLVWTSGSAFLGLVHGHCYPELFCSWIPLSGVPSFPIVPVSHPSNPIFRRAPLSPWVSQVCGFHSHDPGLLSSGCSSWALMVCFLGDWPMPASFFSLWAQWWQGTMFPFALYKATFAWPGV